MKAVALTSAQLDAVDIGRRSEDACIVAGPGSGKTTVLVEYFRRLVAEAGVDPLRILAITFTEKAAGNMRAKLAAQFANDAERRAALERAWVSTVHGFCARLLRENAVLAGVDPEFAVSDQTASWHVQHEALRTAIDGLLLDNPAGTRALIRGLAAYQFETVLLNAYDTMRGAGVATSELTGFPQPAGMTPAELEQTRQRLRALGTPGWNPDQVRKFDEALEGLGRILDAASGAGELSAVENISVNLQKSKRGNATYLLLKDLKDRQLPLLEYTLITSLYARERQLLIEVLRRFDALYRERKRAAGLLDFADLEEFTVRLLESHPETRLRLQRQFDHVLMDELQDTNGQQTRLIGLIRPPEGFYAVGDINQSIFGFRHAEPEGFAAYREEIVRRGRHLVELTGNFRSRAPILSAVETITSGMPGIVTRPLTALREFDDEPAYSVEVIAAADPQMEAQWVARRILELTGEFAFRDFAVLVRNTEVIGEFAAAFDAANIPYVVNRGRGFYKSREVLDLTHLLRAIANPLDEVSLAVVLRSPLAGATDEDLLRLKMNGGGISSGLAACSDHPVLTPFRDRLREWRARREYVTFDRLLAAAIDDCAYPLSPNVDKFLGQARAAAAIMSLDEFMEDLALVREEDPREADAPPEDASDTVKIMTVHSAKGLEFPVVFVAAMHKGVDTNAPVIGFSRHTGLGARWRNPATGRDKSDLYLNALKEEWKRRETEEASRLLYVAMTRAEKHLVLSFSRTERKPSKWDKAVLDGLGLSLEAPGDGLVERTAPDGKRFPVRVLIAADPPKLIPRQSAPEEIAQPELVAPVEAAGQHDSNVTVTGLAKFAACPRQYYLGRYLGYEGRRRCSLDDAGPNDEDRDLLAGEFGDQVHALLAGAPVESPDPEAVRLAEIFDQSALGARAARATRIEREFDFLMAMEDLVVRGQVDLWFEEGGELVVVDYKTDDVRESGVHERAGDYALQLRLYSMAVERITGRAPDRAYLHFLRPDRIVEVDLGPSLLEDPLRVVRDLSEAQARLEFPLNEGARCRSCPFYGDLCPAAL